MRIKATRIACCLLGAALISGAASATQVDEAALKRTAADPAQPEAARLAALAQIALCPTDPQEQADLSVFYRDVEASTNATPAMAERALEGLLGCVKSREGTWAVSGYLAERLRQASAASERSRIASACGRWNATVSSLRPPPGRGLSTKTTLALSVSEPVSYVTAYAAPVELKATVSVPAERTARGMAEPVLLSTAAVAARLLAEASAVYLADNKAEEGVARDCGSNSISVDGMMLASNMAPTKQAVFLDTLLGSNVVAKEQIALLDTLLGSNTLSKEGILIDDVGLASNRVERDGLAVTVAAQSDRDASIGARALILLTSRDVRAERIAGIERILLDLIRKDIKAGGINPRSPELRERLGRYVSEHPFTPEAYDAFVLMLDGSAGNTLLRKMGSLLAWSREAMGGKSESIFSYYAAFHLFRKQHYDQALEFIARYLEKFPTDQDRVYMLRALCFAQKGDTRQAETGLERLRADFPASPMVPEALFLTAWIHFQDGDRSGGTLVLEELRGKYPDSPSARKAAQMLNDLPLQH